MQSRHGHDKVTAVTSEPRQGKQPRRQTVPRLFGHDHVADDAGGGLAVDALPLARALHLRARRPGAPDAGMLQGAAPTDAWHAAT